MRVFVALPIDVRAARNIYHRIAPLREEFPSVRWVAPENYHITLYFVGEIAPDDLERLADELARVEFASFAIDASVSALGFFPPRGRRIRVIHLPLVSGSDRCATVFGKLGDVCRPYCGGGDTRFHPHITLARVRDGGTSALREAVEASRAPQGLRFDRFVLYESTLTPHGSRYAIYRAYSLI